MSEIPCAICCVCGSVIRDNDFVHIKDYDQYICSEHRYYTKEWQNPKCPNCGGDDFKLVDLQMGYNCWSMHEYVLECRFCKKRKNGKKKIRIRGYYFAGRWRLEDEK